MASELELRLVAAHFDHGVRPGSAGEAELVAERARAAGVECRVGRPETPLEATQAAFRKARYAFLRCVADAEGAARIATAHQADDQAETVLHRLLRGTGLRGLRGIPLRRGRVVRPLLGFRRDELLAFLDARGLPYLEDPSNRDPRWTRSRIRHELIPALEEVAGMEVRPSLLALGRLAGRADRALDDAAREAMAGPLGARWEGDPGEDAPARVRLRLSALRRRDPELLARVVRRAARELGVRPRRGGTRVAVEFIKRGRSGAGVDVAENLRVWREFDHLWIGRPPRFEPDEVLKLPDASPGSARLHLGGWPYRVAWGPAGPVGSAGPGDGVRWSAELALAAIEFPLWLRGPRPGDRLRLARGGRKLKRLFNENRVPRSERPRTPVLAGRDRVLWVGGIGSAESAVSSGDEEKFFIGISDAQHGA